MAREEGREVTGDCWDAIEDRKSVGVGAVVVDIWVSPGV